MTLKPVAYLHTLYMVDGRQRACLSFGTECPWGTPSQDYSSTCKKAVTPLYAGQEQEGPTLDAWIEAFSAAMSESGCVKSYGGRAVYISPHEIFHSSRRGEERVINNLAREALDSLMRRHAPADASTDDLQQALVRALQYLTEVVNHIAGYFKPEDYRITIVANPAGEGPLGPMVVTAEDNLDPPLEILRDFSDKPPSHKFEF